MSRWDAVVVGAGMAGSLVAKELGARGWRVLVLEAGPGQPEPASLERFRSAVFKTPNSPYAPAPYAPSADVLDLSRPPGEGHLVQQGPLPYASGYLRANGGTGLVWTGLAPRMHPEDFRAGDFGHGRNWPIGYDQLEPYYQAAEAELGVAADAAEQRAAVGLPMPEQYRFPMPAVRHSHLDTVMAGAFDGRTAHDPAAGAPTPLRVTTTPHARNTTAEGGPRCAGHASCVPICPSHAKYTPLRTQARWSPTVTLVTRAVVTRVPLDGTGRATGVEYRRHDAAGAGPVERVTAGLVVLAAHAVENARLLLLSGAGNRSDQVGRNLMDHPVLLTWGLMPRQVGPYRGPGSTTGLEGFRFGAARARRAPFRVEIGNWGWSWALGGPEQRVAGLLREGLLGAELRRAVGDRVGREFAFQFELEQDAVPSNRVTLHPTLRDPLGLPRPAVHYDLSDWVKRGFASAFAVSEQLMALLGAEDHTEFAPGPLWPGAFEHQGRRYAYRAAGHGAGTHVMGAAPGDSVVDEWQRCWDHPNLYAVGCGSMPSVATANPSLTMAALALRSADRMHHDLTRARRPAQPARTRSPEERP
ncbi:GMC family oxidoreductase [Kitasatospora viridis]|uniref:Choline dehydrogenase-like flavoprotein n=1 Tax=Kitasatospora viridis TaxID=281105 RepID=A0A561UQ91_9ACTN|nr:GMC family oxidoreductase [Kitasatospora viridis]TWG01528.1 choline dehydrogenase-like flavoprotein [Kitasatospora viridis]